jgi:hypothetical protein
LTIGSTIPPPAVFVSFYNRALEIANGEKVLLDREVSALDEDILGPEITSKLNYKSIIQYTAFRVECLPEAAALAEGLMQIGLEKGSLGTLLENTGVYHHLLRHEAAEVAWPHIFGALQAKPTQIITLLRLLGCDFPREFNLSGCRIQHISKQQSLHYGPRHHALFVEAFKHEIESPTGRKVGILHELNPSIRLPSHATMSYPIIEKQFLMSIGYRS